jgi:hypothetical protein
MREPAEGCEVLAGRWTLALGAEPIPMDPGTVTVRLSCSGESVDETEVVVPEGGVANVVLRGRLAPSSALTNVVEPSEGTSDGLWLGVGLGVGGAILLAGGIALAVVLTQPLSPRGDFDPPTLTFGLAGSM